MVSSSFPYLFCSPPLDSTCVVLHSSTSVHLLSDWARSPLIEGIGIWIMRGTRKKPFWPLVTCFFARQVSKAPRTHTFSLKSSWKRGTRYQRIPCLSDWAPWFHPLPPLPLLPLGLCVCGSSFFNECALAQWLGKGPSYRGNRDMHHERYSQETLLAPCYLLFCESS
jgi:hypothetical protein